MVSAQQLSTIRVEKPWGRHALWPGFANPAENEGAVGEIWFDAPAGADPELLVKYLFTSERLSIQVHPDDAAARTAGFPRGKDEAWVVLAAEPNATIALGTTHPVSRDDLRTAALDGSIEALMHWQSVKAGDVIYSPAGTVHAIGAGITLIEVQQNVDLTYRLYDYGRPRALHLDAGIAVSAPVPFAISDASRSVDAGRVILTEGQKFVLERWSWSGERRVTLPDGLTAWFTSVAGGGQIGSTPWKAGECWMLEGETDLVVDAGSDILFAYPLAAPLPLFAAWEN